MFAALFALAPVLKVVVDLHFLGDFRVILGASVAAVYIATALLVLGVVRRSNAVLTHYELIMRNVRRVFYGHRFEEIGALLDVRKNPGVVRQSFRISVAAELICTGVAAATALGLLASAAVAVADGRLGWPKYPALGIAVAAAGVAADVILRLRHREGR